MRRIDTPNRALALFGAGKDGWRDGVMSSGIQATEFNAAFMNELQEELAAIVEYGGGSLTPGTRNQILTKILQLVNSNHFTSGEALPTTNIGPIWHDDYNSMMTWQVFNANGAAYTGYASVLVGNLLMDTQPTARAGYIKSGVTNLNRGTYAALRNWAIHNGIMVLPGVWQAGTIAMADNVDGTTFRVFDVRGEFARAFDDGRGIDAGRVFGSWQAEDIQPHTHPYNEATGTAPQSGSSTPCLTGNTAATTGSTGGVETRPRNTAFLATIKF